MFQVVSLFLDDPTVDWNNHRIQRGEKRNQRRTKNEKTEKDYKKDLNEVMKRIHCIVSDEIPNQNLDPLLTVNGYLNHLIDKASNPDNLALMWHGWQPQC